MAQMTLDDAPDWMGAQADPFSLSAITSSKGWTPQKLVVYGVPGVGKTSFAATFPSPILLRFEDGAGALDIPTFPKIFTGLGDLHKAMQALQGNHDFKTVIIDSLDWMEPLVWDYLCRKEGKADIEAFGFGKGYVLLDKVWRNITASLDGLIDRGLNVVCICHASPVTIDPPDSDPYMSYALKLHKRAAAIWAEWASMILFLNFHKNVVRDEQTAKAKAHGNGDRVIYTSQRPAYLAKSRWPLPPEIFVGNDKTWSAFHEAMKTATEGDWNV